MNYIVIILVNTCKIVSLLKFHMIHHLCVSHLILFFRSIGGGPHRIPSWRPETWPMIAASQDHVPKSLLSVGLRTGLIFLILWSSSAGRFFKRFFLDAFHLHEIKYTCLRYEKMTLLWAIPTMIFHLAYILAFFLTNRELPVEGGGGGREELR